MSFTAVVSVIRSYLTLENRIETVLLAASLIRLFMVFFGSRVLDVSGLDINYTDIDYNIFTDAAQLILAGRCSSTCSSSSTSPFSAAA